MPKLKIAAILAISIVLQLSLREVWRPLSYIDFPLIVVVYVALQRDAWQALIIGTLAGLIVDAASRGLIGAGLSRMNRRVVALTTAGLCAYLERQLPAAAQRG